MYIGKSGSEGTTKVAHTDTLVTTTPTAGGTHNMDKLANVQLLSRLGFSLLILRSSSVAETSDAAETVPGFST
jgi:hypothetical protein